MPKQLECHGFICSSAEDAIIIAANLYQALVDTMKRNKMGGSVGKPKLGDPASPRNLRRDDLSRRSSRRSMRRGEPPVRPPRKKRVKGEEARVVTGLVRRRSIRSSTRSARSNKSNRSTKSARRRMDNRSRPGKVIPLQREDVARKSSRRAGHLDGGMAVSGDLLTKVAIGRTKSFVKTGNQYNLQELFKELKEKEGVESIDDVLKRVITPNGMSFNDIKPVYRELLLKLAMTMSQDEIFERSKSIMASSKKLKKKQRDQENSGSLGSFFKSFSRPSSKTNSLATKKQQAIQSERLQTDKLVKPSKSNKASKSKHLTKADISGPLPIKEVHQPTMSAKEKEAMGKDEQTDDAYGSCSECTYESVCNYDSCTCRIKKSIRPAAEDIKKLISQGKDVLSECDGDSCISSDKCYCSLRGDPRSKGAHSSVSVYSEVTADSGTVTDTSCYSTNCYGSHSGSSSKHHLPLSSCASPMTAWKNATMNEKESMQTSSCCSCSEYESSGATSASLTYKRHLPPIPTDSASSVQRRKSSVAGSSFTGSSSNLSFSQQWQGNNSLRRNLLDGRGSEGSSSCSSSSNRSSVSPTNSSSRSFLSSPTSSSTSPKVLVVSAVDPRGNLVYRGSQQQQRLTTAQSRDEENILSLKKSAEIAALFSGAKISQTTDLVDKFGGSESESCSCSRGSLGRSTSSSNHPGNHLGYFP